MEEAQRTGAFHSHTCLEPALCLPSSRHVSGCPARRLRQVSGHRSRSLGSRRAALPSPQTRAQGESERTHPEHACPPHQSPVPCLGSGGGGGGGHRVTRAVYRPVSIQPPGEMTSEHSEDLTRPPARQASAAPNFLTTLGSVGGGASAPAWSSRLKTTRRSAHSCKNNLTGHRG